MKHLGKMLILVLAVALLCGLLCACKKDLPTGETGLPDTGDAAGAGDSAVVVNLGFRHYACTSLRRVK